MITQLRRWGRVILVVAIVSTTLITVAQPSIIISRRWSPRSINLIRLKSVPILIDNYQSDVDQLLATISAQAVMVTDEDSGVILLAKNLDLPLYPASTTKLMTALVAREIYALTDVLRVGSETFAQAQIIKLLPGQKITVENLLKGLLIGSGNDAALLLANHHAQGYPGFVESMNQLAKRLHLSQTHFTNPSGLDVTGHQITARDLGLLTRAVMSDEVLRELLGESQAVMTDVTGKIIHDLTNTHQLVRSDSSVVAGKTGTTLLAGQVLVTDYQRSGRRLQIVVMNSQNRYADTQLLISWSTTHFSWLDPTTTSLVD